MTQTQAFRVEHWAIRTLFGLGHPLLCWRAVLNDQSRVLCNGRDYDNMGGLLDDVRLLFGADVEVVDLDAEEP